MNVYNANVSPSRTPATISKKSVSPSAERTMTFMLTSLWPWHFLWGDHTPEVFGEIYEQECHLDVFARAPSMIQQIVRICDVVNQFLQKPFWFFQRIYSISGSMHGCKSYDSVVLGGSEVTFLGKGEDAAFFPSLYYVLLIYAIAESEQ